MRKLSITLFIVVLILSFISCDGLLDLFSNALGLSEKVQDVAPAFVATRSRADWYDPGNPVYEMYQYMQEYRGQVDEGIVSPQNFYKVLHDADSSYSGMIGNASSIPAQVIVPPFNFGNNYTYDMAANFIANGPPYTAYARRSVASYENGSVTTALIGYIWDPDMTQWAHGVTEIQFDNNTQDLSLDMIMTVDYDPTTTIIDTSGAGGFITRLWVEGNMNSHSFKLKVISGNPNGNYSVTNLIAMGISEGTGNYFLLKAQDTLNGDKYYVIPADADEAVLRTITPADPNNLPATVASYETWVKGESFFSSSDMISDNASFNPGISGLAGTIYLNFTK